MPTTDPWEIMSESGKDTFDEEGAALPVKLTDSKEEADQAPKLKKDLLSIEKAISSLVEKNIRVKIKKYWLPTYWPWRCKEFEHFLNERGWMWNYEQGKCKKCRSAVVCTCAKGCDFEEWDLSAYTIWLKKKP